MAFESAWHSGRLTGAPVAADTAADDLNSNDPDPEINVSTVNNNPEDESNIVTEKPVLTNKPVESTANEIKTERNNCKRKGPGLAKC